jgi:hypothetical protein
MYNKNITQRQTFGEHTMNDLLDIQCDEAPYIPTQDDWAEWELWLDAQERQQPQDFVVVGENFRPENCEDCPF